MYLYLCLPSYANLENRTQTENFEDNQEDYLNSSFYQNGFLYYWTELKD